MEIFYIKNNLEKVSLKQAVKHEHPYVAIADNEEFIKNNDFFDMGIDLELDTVGPTTTKAEVNYDSVIGTFSIPDRNNITEVQHRFCFCF